MIEALKEHSKKAVGGLSVGVVIFMFTYFVPRSEYNELKARFDVVQDQVLVMQAINDMRVAKAREKYE